MALMPCEECGREISSRASACPHCGCPVLPKTDTPPAAIPATASTLTTTPLSQPSPSPPASPSSPTEPSANHADVPFAPAPPAPEGGAPVLPKPPWSTTPTRPWLRWAARLLDTYLLGLLIVWLIGVYISGIFGASASSRVFSSDAFTNQALSAILVSGLVTVPIAYLIGAMGTTPGKALFGIRVVTPEGKAIGFSAGIGRELQVFITGLAFGIPLVQIFTMLAAKRGLEQQGHCSWDPPSLRIVEYRALSIWLVISVWIGIVAIAALVVITQALARMGAGA